MSSQRRRPRERRHHQSAQPPATRPAPEMCGQRSPAISALASLASLPFHEWGALTPDLQSAIVTIAQAITGTTTKVG